MRIGPARPPAILARLCLAAWLGCGATGAVAQRPQSVDFDRDVAPIIVSHCLECHGGFEAEGGLRLSDQDVAMAGGESGPAIDAGNASASLLWERVANDEMPPDHPLDDADKERLRRWIDQGARWGTRPLDPFATTTRTRAGRDWWSLQPLRRVPLPELTPSKWIRNEIDSFVLAQLRAAGLTHSLDADPRTLIRRLYFDLVGLPPTPEQVAAFVADPCDASYQRIVDELLASPHYGERWARHWLDVVRFGESDGFERNQPRDNAWPYRDWVIDAFNRDLPYDDFVRMQLVGDLIRGGPEGAAATGFWVAGVHNTVVGGSDRMKSLARQDEIEEVLATLGQSFLGLTVNCARCHDHKFDPISQEEFYQLASCISGLEHGERVERDEAEWERWQVIERRLADRTRQLDEIDHRAMLEILAARRRGEASPLRLPAPLARWDFEGHPRDRQGTLNLQLVGDASIVDGALVVGANAYAQSPPIEQSVGEKTLEVWVQLDRLDQRGGGAISIETLDGDAFDAIVFAEATPNRWMAGSERFERTQPFDGADEVEAVNDPVHLVWVYQPDGGIVAYRNGDRYGQVVRKSDLRVYPPGRSHVLFGLRHQPAVGNRSLEARIFRAAVYDRALEPAEVTLLADAGLNDVTGRQIDQWLDDGTRARRRRLRAQIASDTLFRGRHAALATQTIYTLQPRPAQLTHVLWRGDPELKGPPVRPGAISALSGVSADFRLAADAPEAERRRQLSQWVTSPSNPIFSRVAVNRMWHYHFGTGLVDTPNDFGFNGGRPSHPDLLDRLAFDFREGGLQVKALHRLIVTSSTYRQASYGLSERQRRKALAIDADNRLLWRGASRRLEAEAVRDAMLSVAGCLRDASGGPGFRDVTVDFNNGTTYYEPVTAEDPQYFRRTVYRFNPRGGRSALLDTFDCPDPASTAPQRAVTVTPLQALSLLNNSFVLRMSDLFARRLQKECVGDRDRKILRAWQLALAREPAESEWRWSRELVQRHGLSALTRGLFNTNEFVIIP